MSKSLLIKQVRISPEMLVLLRNEEPAPEDVEGAEQAEGTEAEPNTQADSAQPPRA